MAGALFEMKLKGITVNIQTERLTLGVGFFSHIIIDEAGQGLEPEVLVPLSLKGPSMTVSFVSTIIN